MKGLLVTRWRAVAACVAGVLCLGAAAFWVSRSPAMLEWISGADADGNQLVPQARKNDRLEVPDAMAVVTQRDAEEHARLGRPSVEAVWALRQALPSPSEWIRMAQPPAPVDPQAPIAYASGRATDQPERDPFRVIDEPRLRGGTESTTPPQEAIPIPLPRPQTARQAEEEEDEEEEEVIPVPLPRPRNIPQRTETAAAPTPPPAPAAPAARPGTTTTATPPATPPATTRAAPAEQPAQPRVQVAALTQPTERDIPGVAPRAPAPSIMTPFGVPFTLQHSSVQTNCFPPALVELLRRIERHYGRKPIITSGLRSRGRSGSLHRRCMAADIIVTGVSSTELARVARTIPGMGGVGQYCHPNMIHVDIGTQRDWRYGCGSFFALRDGSVQRGRVPGRLVNRE